MTHVIVNHFAALQQVMYYLVIVLVSVNLLYCTAGATLPVSYSQNEASWTTLLDNSVGAWGTFPSGNGLSWSDASYNGTLDAFDTGMMCLIGNNYLSSGNFVNELAPGWYRTNVLTLLSGISYFYDLQVNPHKPSICRGYLSIKNTNASPVGTSVTCASNAGADSRYRILDSHSGDNIFDTTDRWLYTDDNGGNDPSLFWAFSGESGQMIDFATTTVWSSFGIEGVGFGFDIALGAGETKSMMYFVEMVNPGSPPPEAKYLNMDTLQQNPDLTMGLSFSELENTVNWGIPSPSKTPATIPSPSQTSTGTPTTTRSLSSTPTSSRSSTPTPSNTKTSTVTPTGSQSGTTSSTPTRTDSVTQTPTVSDSKTPSNTRTPSKTPTKTGTGTRTVTKTQTPTSSVTSTGSDTKSATKTQTPSTTVTADPTTSRTSTKTSTISTTSSRTISVSKSLSGSRSESITASTTITASRSPSSSLTPSTTRSESSTTSSTVSLSSSVSFSRSVSPSETPTSSNSFSATISKSASNTKSMSSSVTISRSPSKSRTNTRSPSRSPSSSRSATNSISTSRSITGTRSPTPTPTETTSPTKTTSPTRSASDTSSSTPSNTIPLSKSPSTSSTQSAMKTQTSTRSNTASPTSTRSPTATETSTVSPTTSITGTKTTSLSQSTSSSVSQSFVLSFGASPLPSLTRTFFSSIDLVAPALSKSPNLISSSASSSVTPTSSLSRLCINCVTVSPTKVALNGRPAGEVIVSSNTGESVVVIIVPQNLENALPLGSTLNVKQVDLTGVSTTRIGSTSAIDVTLTDEKGDEIPLPDIIELCFEVNQSENFDEACLGFLDENGEWVCEDECLTSNEEGKYCGETDHFTSFAILLDGGRGEGSACSSSVAIDSLISYLSLAFVIVAIVVFIIAAIGFEFRIRHDRFQGKRHLKRLGLAMSNDADHKIHFAK